MSNDAAREVLHWQVPSCKQLLAPASATAGETPLPVGEDPRGMLPAGTSPDTSTRRRRLGELDLRTRLPSNRHLARRSALALAPAHKPCPARQPPRSSLLPVPMQRRSASPPSQPPPRRLGRIGRQRRPPERRWEAASHRGRLWDAQAIPLPVRRRGCAVPRRYGPLLTPLLRAVSARRRPLCVFGRQRPHRDAVAALQRGRGGRLLSVHATAAGASRMAQQRARAGERAGTRAWARSGATSRWKSAQ